jgi:hypothetical protein
MRSLSFRTRWELLRIRVNLIERIKRFPRPRWRIAGFMDHYRDTCWSRLVEWAHIPDEHGWLDVWYLRHTAGRCYRSGDTPYCGKCWVTGLHVELGGMSREEAEADWRMKHELAL